MNHKERIAELEKEIERFDYERLKRQEKLLEIQVELSDINKAILTRQGEIIGLKRLIKEDDPNTP